ncbi:MAG: hypothetical protein LBF89_04730, partial [Bacteroidales bacterium]|nr:hypothetical protein [Bacteroidales bacterium]
MARYLQRERERERERERDLQPIIPYNICARTREIRKKFRNSSIAAVLSLIICGFFIPPTVLVAASSPSAALSVTSPFLSANRYNTVIDMRKYGDF